MKAYWGSGGITPRVLELCARWTSMEGARSKGCKLKKIGLYVKWAVLNTHFNSHLYFGLEGVLM
jgi:hypothetical protein